MGVIGISRSEKSTPPVVGRLESAPKTADCGLTVKKIPNFGGLRTLGGLWGDIVAEKKISYKNA